MSQSLILKHYITSNITGITCQQHQSWTSGELAISYLCSRDCNGWMLFRLPGLHCPSLWGSSRCWPRPWHSNSDSRTTVAFGKRLFGCRPWSCDEVEVNVHTIYHGTTYTARIRRLNFQYRTRQVLPKKLPDQILLGWCGARYIYIYTMSLMKLSTCC